MKTLQLWLQKKNKENITKLNQEKKMRDDSILV